jgi:CRP-like cAMP-binding protein
MVRTLSYRAVLDGDDREAILSLPCTVKMVERLHYLVRERDRATQTCVMLSGYSVRSKLVGDGSRQIVAIHMKGDTVDLHNSLLGIADHSVQTLVSSKVGMIPRDEIVRIAEKRPQVGRAMWLETLADASLTREWVANIGRRDARSRLAHLFCEFAVRMKVAGLADENQFELPMTQEQLADATGLTSVHVNRTIRVMESEGLIRRLGRRAVAYDDWRKLAEVGDFDTNYLHLNTSEPALAWKG